MAADNRASVLLPSVGEFDVWPRAVKVQRVIVGVTSSDGDEDIVIGTTGTQDFQLWDVQAGTLVYNIVGLIETAFTASCTLEVGDTTDINGWLLAAHVAATSTGDQMIYSTDGADTTTEPAYAMGARGASQGKWYQSSGTIECDISGATPAVGRAIFYVHYAQLSS